MNAQVEQVEQVDEMTFEKYRAAGRAISQALDGMNGDDAVKVIASVMASFAGNVCDSEEELAQLITGMSSEFLVLFAGMSRAVMENRLEAKGGMLQ